MPTPDTPFIRIKIIVYNLWGDNPLLTPTLCCNYVVGNNLSSNNYRGTENMQI